VSSRDLLEGVFLNMTRSDIINRIYQAYPEFGRRLIEDVVTLFFSEIVAQLQKGSRVELRGLGSFSLRLREARNGRNPKTGENVSVPKKNVPFFKAGKELRLAVNARSYKSTNAKRRNPSSHLHSNLSL
jgi:integration host factor subunit beta